MKLPKLKIKKETTFITIKTCHVGNWFTFCSHEIKFKYPHVLVSGSQLY